MKTLRLISLAILVLVICSGHVYAQPKLCGIAINANPFRLSDDSEAGVVHIGEQIYYYIILTNDLNNYDMNDVEPYIEFPDGTFIDLGNNIMLPASGREEFDTRDYPINGPSTTNGVYTVRPEDLQQFPLEIPPDPQPEVVAHVHVDSTCIRASGPDPYFNDGYPQSNVISEPNTVVEILANPTDGFFPYSTDLTVTETNTGLDPLTNVTVTVSSVPGITGFPVVLDSSTAIESMTDDNILEVGETWTWNATTNSVLNDVEINTDPTTFTAIGSGYDPLGIEVTYPEYENERDIVICEGDYVPPPCIDVTKVVDCSVSKVGDEVIYTICIINCGDTTVFPTRIEDDVLGDLLPIFESPPPVGCFFETPLFLFPGESCCLDFPYTIQPEDDPGEIPDNFGNTLVNTVIFEAIDEFEQDANDMASAVVGLVHPCLDVDVECISDPNITPGDNAEFRVTLNNCGDIDLSVDVVSNWGICEGTDLYIPWGSSESCEGSVPVPLDWVDPDICLDVVAHWDIFDDLEGCLDNEDTVDANACCPVEYPGGEGCTPGFWKNNGDNHGASAWCERFDPSDPFSTHFSLIEPLVIRGNGKSTITNPTLLQALDANGGGVNAMIRHGVAAMLNACSDCVQYEYSSPDQVISMIEDTLNGAPGAYTVDELHSMFAENNEAGCPVNQHGDCVGVDGD